MASENETVEDVLNEMRDRKEVRKVRLRQYGGVQCNCSIAPDDVPAVYADRIESAWRREKFVSKEVAELRECLKEAVDFHCGKCINKGGLCNKYCLFDKWRKSLEGAK